jgi:hypothetical protein
MSIPNLPNAMTPFWRATVCSTCEGEQKNRKERCTPLMFTCKVNIHLPALTSALPNATLLPYDKVVVQRISCSGGKMPAVDISFHACDFSNQT